jgi:Fe-S cluster assembly protein SufD
MVIKEAEEILKKFSSNGSPRWLGELRQKAWRRFNDLGIPTVKEEEWKYTNLSPVTQHQYLIPSRHLSLKVPDLDDYIHSNEITLVLENGFLNPQWSNIPFQKNGVSILSLHDVAHSQSDYLKKLFAYFNELPQATSFVSLNQALHQDGIVIEVKKNTASPRLIHLIHVITGKEQALTFPRTLIHLEASSELTVLETHLCLNDTSVYFTSPLTEIVLEENSTLHYCKAQKESLKAFHVGSTRVWQERNSHFDGFSVIGGASITRNNLDAVLNGEGATSTLNGLYSLRENQLADNHTFVDHRSPQATSNQFYKGILNDSSRAVFNGKILVRPIAQLTNSYQLNKNLLLGPNCRVDTQPQLEIFADDVKCTHGATIGQLNEDEVFYFQSRSISRRDAVKMLSVGFVEDVLNKIASENINQKMHKLLAPSFQAF